MASSPSDQKTSSQDRKGSAEVRKGSGETTKGSGEAKKKSFARTGSAEARRASVEEWRGSAEDQGSLSTIPSSVKPSEVPWVTLLRALGRFKLALPEIRRDRLLATHDPLSLERPALPCMKHKTPVKRFWGDHQPLSKIPYKILIGHRHPVSSCHFCVNDTKLLSGSHDCSVKLWDAADGFVVRNFEPQPKAPVSECSITADSRRIVASAYDKSVRAWDVETGQMLWKVRHDTFVVSCKFSPDGKYVVSALDVDRSICIMDPENITTVIYVKDHHTRSITACCFDPDSQKVASVSMDRCIKIWDVTSQATLLTITKAHANTISDCCFTFSGHFLCTSSWDKDIKIWNVHTGEFRNKGACVTLMKGHEGCVSSCCFARDSSFLISGGFDKTVAIWDVGEGYRKLSLKGHNDWVMDVAISSNKKWILSASKDKTLRLWNIEGIDQIPLVMENQKASGFKVKQCTVCDQPFSTFESDTATPELATQCVFCRRDAEGSSSETSSLLSLEENKE
ncbi:WD repeat-containing protein 88 [Nannospalax galili]|uniref:WD repeat-containing protein 88 n=1 Tax=Nannospalax galili TaxID=1026970 RepID=UPI0004ED22ED|nr:WD repeat-containing protein 88 [Nannospalax galili]